MAWSDYDNPENIWSGFLQLDSDGAGAISGAAVSKSYILIPINDATGLANLTVAEATLASGDARKVVYELAESFYQWYNGIASGSTPGKITVSRSGLVGTGSTADRTYTVKVTLDTSGLDVVAE